MTAAPISIHRTSVGKGELEAVRLVLESRWLGMGPVTAAFEERIREAVGSRHAIAVSSGSAALHLALLAVGVRPGDEIMATGAVVIDHVRVGSFSVVGAGAVVDDDVPDRVQVVGIPARIVN